MLKPIRVGLFILSVSLLLGCSGNGKHSSTPPVNLGAALPLTGTAAVWGKNARNGMELARREINNAGGIRGRELRIIYEDTQGLPQQGVSAIQKLIRIDHVPAVMGCITSSTTLAMAPVAREAGVVLFSPGASSPKLSDSGPYFFRNFPSDAIEAPEIARMVRNHLGLQRVAILYVNNEFGRGHEMSFRTEFERLGGVVVAAESFPQEASDFRIQITKIAEQHPQGLFLPGYPQEMPSVLRQIIELGLDAQIVCPSALIDDQLLATAGETAAGVIFADQRPPDGKSEIVRHFREAYTAEYHEEPGIVCDTSYDAVRILAQCIQRGGDTGPQIRDQLAALGVFDGAAGRTSFDAHGDVTKTPIFRTVQNGHIALFWDNPQPE